MGKTGAQSFIEPGVEVPIEDRPDDALMACSPSAEHRSPSPVASVPADFAGVTNTTTALAGLAVRAEPGMAVSRGVSRLRAASIALFAALQPVAAPLPRPSLQAAGC